MVRYKIIYDKKGCEGVFACVALAPDYWEVTSDNKKVDLKNGVLNEKTGMYELELDDDAYDENVAAADVCPVNVIKVEKIE